MINRIRRLFTRIGNFLFGSSEDSQFSKIAPPVSETIRIPDDQTLYDALAQRGLLRQPGFPRSLGIYLVKEGEIGLTLNNGVPEFLAPGGRYTLWSPFRWWLGVVPITQKVIELGPCTVVTIPQGELGLSQKNDSYEVLEPGRYILSAPHVFIHSVKASEKYIELGTHRRISVAKGEVALAWDNGKQVIIHPRKPEEEGPYITNSPTFRFDPKTGFKSTRLEEIQLQELSVNTREMIALKVVGLIRYRISDPEKAFLKVDDVHNMIKLQAEATLTSVFAQLSIDDIGASLSSSILPEDKSKQSNDLIHKATDLFISEFKKVVDGWGVELNMLNIMSMQSTDKAYVEAVLFRTRKNIEAKTNLANIAATNEVALLEAKRQAEQLMIKAGADATATRMRAEADVYAAEALAKTPLAAQLRMMDMQVQIAEKMAAGNSTVYLPHNAALNLYATTNNNSPMLFGQTQARQSKLGISVDGRVGLEDITPAVLS